ncbi:hypothetical protein D3C80_486920 [compost metagenome]
MSAVSRQPSAVSRQPSAVSRSAGRPAKRSENRQAELLLGGLCLAMPPRQGRVNWVLGIWLGIRFGNIEARCQ